MASRSKEVDASVRHPVPGREYEVQGFDNEEVQALKAIIRDIQATLDSNRNTGPKRDQRSFWADIHTGSGTFIGTIHHTLSEPLFRQVRVQSLRLVSARGSVPRDHREDKPVDSPAQRRGLSKNARNSKSSRGSHPTSPGDEDL